MKKPYLIYMIFTLLAFILIFSHLDYPFLWQDEADTALLAKRILTYSIPKVWDGRNIITQFGHFHQMGWLDFNKDLIHTWQPWLQFYIAALSMLLLGSSTLACRLPFAVMGFLAFIYYLYFCRKHLKLSNLYYLPGLLLVFSVPFLLSARQCRYYAPNMLLTLLFTGSFISLLKKERHSDLVFAFAGVALLLNNFLSFIPTFLAFIIYLLLSRKDIDRKYLLRSGAMLLIGISLYAALRIYLDGDMPPFLEFTGNQFFPTLRYYLSNFNSWSFPFIVPVILFASLIAGKEKPRIGKFLKYFDDRTIRLILLIVSLNMLFLSFVIQVNFRYIVHIVPLGLMLLAHTLSLISARSKIAYVLILIAFLFTNLLGKPLTHLPQILAKYEKIDIKYPFFSFLNNIIIPKPEGNTCIVKYLLANSKKDDVVVTDYDDEPIMLYTGLVVRGGLRGVGILSEDSSSYNDIFRQIGVTTVKSPDWVIPRKYGRFQEELINMVKNNSYKKIYLDCPDSRCGNNPDPNSYFREEYLNDPKVLIYKRVD